MSSEKITVGIADVKSATSPAMLVTIGLGSCVGIALYDSRAKIGSLAHIMLPSSKSFKSVSNRGKFADTAIPLAVNEMTKLGARRDKICAKIAGGAKMFSFNSGNGYIGEKNVSSVKEILEGEKIRVVAEDTGGRSGRTLKFDTARGKLLVKTAEGEVKKI